MLRTAAPTIAQPSTVASVESLSESSDVYDLNVQDVHEFFAGGILVHNCDEVGLWEDWDTAWNYSLRLAVRMDPGLIVATGTPKIGHGLVKQLLDSPSVACTRMRMADNIGNLPPELVQAFYDEFGGTRRARQELEGEFIEEIPGALWTMELIDRSRLDELPPLDRIAVGVDPSGASDAETGANSIGIVVCGYSSFTGHGYVLGDYTIRGGPETWAAEVCKAYERHGANYVVAEGNYGGEMVRYTLHVANPTLPVRLTNASHGKAVRADPVALLYDQGKIHHLRNVDLAALEDQMTTWVPPRPGQRTHDSPDRMDALVWALTELMVDRSGGGQSTYRPDVGGEPIIRRGGLTLIGAHHIDADRR